MRTYSIIKPISLTHWRSHAYSPLKRSHTWVWNHHWQAVFAGQHYKASVTVAAEISHGSCRPQLRFGLPRKAFSYLFLPAWDTRCLIVWAVWGESRWPFLQQGNPSLWIVHNNAGWERNTAAGNGLWNGFQGFISDGQALLTVSVMLVDKPLLNVICSYIAVQKLICANEELLHAFLRISVAGFISVFTITVLRFLPNYERYLYVRISQSSQSISWAWPLVRLPPLN